MTQQQPEEDTVDANLVIASLKEQISESAFQIAVLQAKLATSADRLTKAMQALSQAHQTQSLQKGDPQAE